MSIVVLIPARGGSKGIKLKNIVPIAGKPLIYYATKACEDSVYVNKVIIATDLKKIENVVNGFGFYKVEIYKRLKRNAQDNSKTIDLVLEFVKFLDPNDILILVQATSPLVTYTDIDNAIKRYLESSCDSMLSCIKADGFYWTDLGEPILHEQNNRKRRQDYDSKVLKENGAIYINKVQNIISEKSLLSGEIEPFIMNKDTSLEIDEPNDIILAEKLLRKRVIDKVSKADYKMFLCDCDGTLTDGGMYYSKNGEEMKKFNTKDGFGITTLQKNGYIVGIITGENNDIVRKRAKKLKISELHMGVKNKLSVVKEIAKKYKINLEQIVYVGDDMNDYDVIKNVGLGCATYNACDKLKNIAKYTTKLAGGMGAVREVIDLLCADIED